MEPERCGDGDYSPQLQSALKRFQDVCCSLEDEQKKLTDLESRRKKIQDDLESLRQEIIIEKNNLRLAIDEQRDETLELFEQNEKTVEVKENVDVVQNVVESNPLTKNYECGVVSEENRIMDDFFEK